MKFIWLLGLSLWVVACASPEFRSDCLARKQRAE